VQPRGASLVNDLEPGTVRKKADEISQEYIEFLTKLADGDPQKLLSLLDTGLKASKRHQDRLKALRLQTVKDLRDAGVPMIEIAAAANVNDSYLARLVIADGGARRNDRTRRRRRRILPPGQTA
jgi:replication-associated recombination protein RarA